MIKLLDKTAVTAAINVFQNIIPYGYPDSLLVALAAYINTANLVEGWKLIDDKARDGGWYIFGAKGRIPCVSAYNKGWNKPRHWDFSVPPTHYMEITEIKE